MVNQRLLFLFFVFCCCCCFFLFFVFLLLLFFCFFCFFLFFVVVVVVFCFCFFCCCCFCTVKLDATNSLILFLLIRQRYGLKMGHTMRKPNLSQVNKKGVDQPAHPRSLISAFVVHCLDSNEILQLKAI